MLQSQLFSPAKDICRAIPGNDIQSGSGWKKTVEAIYKLDALSVVSEVYQNFTGLLPIPLGNNETFSNFETRFIEQVSKFISNCSSTKLPEALTALVLLANSFVDSGQRISLLAAASNTSSVTASASTDDYLKTLV